MVVEAVCVSGGSPSLVRLLSLLLANILVDYDGLNANPFEFISRTDALFCVMTIPLALRIGFGDLQKPSTAEGSETRPC